MWDFIRSGISNVSSSFYLIEDTNLIFLCFLGYRPPATRHAIALLLVREIQAGGNDTYTHTLQPLYDDITAIDDDGGSNWYLRWEVYSTCCSMTLPSFLIEYYMGVVILIRAM